MSSFCSYCGTAGGGQGSLQTPLPWSCVTCLAKYCTFHCMNTDKTDHAKVCLKEPAKKTFSRTYYNSSNSSSEATKQLQAVKTQQSKLVCRFFTAGQCTKGVDCSYSHERPVCEHFLKNSCNYGDSCWKLHPAHLKTENKSFNPKVDQTKMKKPPKFEQAQLKTGKKAPYSKIEQAQLKTEQKPVQPKGDTKRKSGKNVQKLSDEEDEKRLICEHFQRGDCAYGDSCYKLHEMPRPKIIKEIPAKKETLDDKTDKAPICEHFQRGTCAYGDTCFKKHVKVPLFKPSYRPKNVANEEKVDLHSKATSDESKSTLDDIFMSDSESEELVEIEDRKSIQKKPKLSPVNLFEVLTSPNEDTSSSGEESDKENNEAVSLKKPEMKTSKKVKNDNIVTTSYNPNNKDRDDNETINNAEKKKLKKERQKLKKQTEIDNARMGLKREERERMIDNVEKEEVVSMIEAEMESAEDITDDKFNQMIIDNNDPKAIHEAEKKRLKKERQKQKKQEEIDAQNKINAIAEEKERKEKEKREQQAKYNLQKRIVTLKELGNKDFNASKYQSAVKHYTEAISLCEPNNPVPAIYNNRCQAFLLLERFESALEDGRKVVEFELDNTKAHYRIVKCCLALGEVEEGKKSLSKLKDESDVGSMKSDLERLDRLYKEVLGLQNKKSYKAAIETLNRCLKISPQSSKFLTLKAKFLVLEKSISEARKVLEGVDVKTSLYQFVTGLCCYYEDDLEKAISSFAQAKREVSEAQEWHEKAMAMHNAFISGNKVVRTGGDYSSALASLDTGLAMDMGNSAYMAKMFYTRALLSIRYDKQTAAVTDCTSAIQYNPLYYKAWAKRGSLQLDMEKYTEAVSDLTEAYRLKSTREAFNALEDAKKRKTRAENRKPTHYQILGVEKKATTEEIKKAYRAKAREFHPDKHANSSKEEQGEMESKMKEVSAANQCLSDPAKRVEYDRRMERMLMEDDSDQEDYGSDEEDECYFDVHDFFSHIFGMYVGVGGVGGSFRSRHYCRW
eukprot:GFUD01030728.1.p1 GENE.GFUD01030728.1~~GFUD01030728.1.p1  ORF type:complete len:1013 (+),score=326.13 GFUD01030728.1:58-3096(+)